MADHLCGVETCHRDADGIMCPFHERQLESDFRWLMANVDDLEHYRINRAWGHHEPNGPRMGVPAPVREGLAVALWQTDDRGNPGLMPLLKSWARTLALTFPDTVGLRTLAYRVATCYRLKESTATPVYARELHACVRRLRRMLDASDADGVILGPCPNPDCGVRLTGIRGEDHVRCPRCGCDWDVDHLRKERNRRILDATMTAPQKTLCDLLNECGVKVNFSTMRAWVHKGMLPQTGENDESKPVYRLADAYRLATAAREGDVDANLWELIDGGDA